MSGNHSYITNSHIRIHTEFAYGKGLYLYGKDGTQYLDFMSGIAVNSLGHCHKSMVEIIHKQSQKLWHISNLFYSASMDECAKTLCNATNMEKVFFTNSGSEAVETAIKMARKFFHDQGQNKYEIITMKNSFHGRSITNISASGAYTKGFYPLLEGFTQVEYGNIEALEGAISNKTAGILLEPIQGEGGLNFAGLKYLQEVSRIAIKYGILLLTDEVQCGASRTGKFLASQWAEVTPDIVAMAKGIGGGFPVGATLFAKNTSNVLTVGSHGTTFGGNPLAMAVTNAVCTELLSPPFMQNINKQAEYLCNELQALQAEYPEIIKEICGFGLMVGFVLDDKFTARDISSRFFANNLITAPAQRNVIRLLPPLIVEKHHIDEAIEIIRKTFNQINN